MKERLDVLLVKRQLAQSREKAKAIIMSGIVYVDGQKEDKAGAVFEEKVNIEVRGNTLPFVSRGGLKLDKAFRVFPIDVKGCVCLDIGASTGGFTDCMLQNGAVKVFAIDVGYGQLAWSLRQDERVVNMERTNVRNVTPVDIGELLDLASIDVAFISLEKVLPAVIGILKAQGEIVALIKPQFEAGKEKVGKKGVVRDPAVHQEVIFKVLSEAKELGLTPTALTYSPVKGPEGNIEYLVWLLKGAENAEEVPDELVLETVKAAHAKLDV